MEHERALEVILSLVDGVDPMTGEVFPEQSIYQHPVILRALFAASKAMQHGTDKPARPVRQLPPNAGKPWTGDEDHQLAAGFDAGATEKELAAKHLRTVGSVRSRLVKLGKLEAVPPQRRHPPGVRQADFKPAATANPAG